MMREYHFAALVYDSEHRRVHCALCGRAVDNAEIMLRVGGRWACKPCVETGALPCSEPTLAETLRDIAET